jgi:hypothetical protein
LIVVVTPSAKASEYVTYEWAFAWGVGVKVIPVLLEPTPLHPRLEVLQYLDFSIRSARPWDKLLARLRDASGNSRTGSPRGQDGVVLNIPGIVQNALANLDNVDPQLSRFLLRAGIQQKISNWPPAGSNTLRDWCPLVYGIMQSVFSAASRRTISTGEVAEGGAATVR